MVICRIKGVCERAVPFEGHINAIVSVHMSADGRHLLSGSWDKTLKLWDMAKWGLPSHLPRTRPLCLFGLPGDGRARSIEEQ